MESRWVPLTGAVNVRDVGGLPLAGGGTVAPGRLLRADNLQGLTPSDVRTLVDDRGLRTVIDLRTVIEVEREGPGPLTREPVVAVLHHSLFPEGGVMTDIDADALLPWQNAADRGVPDDNPSVGFYLAYLRDRPDSVVASLRAIAASPGAAVVNCAAGKDRTGVVVALALEVAGVPRDAIVADYIATGDVLDRLMARLGASSTYAADLDSRPLDSHRPRPETMRRFLEVLDERYDGPLGWLGKAGFDDGDVTALRARLVGPVEDQR